MSNGSWLSMEKPTEERAEAAELDPTLWSCLPADLCEEVFSKVPSLRLAKFRLVCTTWKNEFIPLAARLRHRTHSPGADFSPAMLFGSNYRLHSTARPFLRRVCTGLDANKPCRPTWLWNRTDAPYLGLRYFDDPHSRFLNPLLLASEVGLLFFTLTHSPVEDKLPRGSQAHSVLVCNPLTRQDRVLRIPYNSDIDGVHVHGHTLLGVVPVIREAEEGYKLVVGRFDGFGSMSYISVYSSFDRAWKQISNNGLLEVQRRTWIREDDRAICHDGNLYWFVQSGGDGPGVPQISHEIIIYNVDTDTLTWKLAPGSSLGNLNLDSLHYLRCLGSFSHIVSEKGELLLGHLPNLSKKHVEQLGLSTGVTLIRMPPGMISRVVEFIARSPEGVRNPKFDYFGFRHKNKFYHSVLTEKRLGVIIQDLLDGSYSQEEFEEAEAMKYFKKWRLWVYSPSLTTLV